MPQIIMKILMTILSDPSLFANIEEIFTAIEGHNPQPEKITQIAANLGNIGAAVSKSLAVRNGANG